MRFLLNTLLLASIGIGVIGATATSANAECTFALTIKNETGHDVLIRKIAYKIKGSIWEWIDDGGTDIVIAHLKHGGEHRDDVTNRAKQCSARHSWKVRYVCSTGRTGTQTHVGDWGNNRNKHLRKVKGKRHTMVLKDC